MTVVSCKISFNVLEMPSNTLKGGARPWGPGKNTRRNKRKLLRTRKNNITNNNRNRIAVEAQIAALTLEAARLRSIANSATVTARKIRQGKITQNAANKIIKHAKQNANLAKMFSGLGK